MRTVSTSLVIELTSAWKILIVLKAANTEDFSEQLQAVMDVYGSNIDAPTLQMQLQILGANRQ